MPEKLKALAQKWRDTAYDLQRFGQGGGIYLVCANELLSALEQAAPEGCRSLPAAEQAVALMDDWLLFSDDIQPACAAGHDWLDSLRARTQIALAKLRQGEKPACLPEPPEGE